MPRVRELTIAYRPHPSGVATQARRLATPKDAAAVLIPILGNQTQEVFTVLLLGTRNHLIAVHEIARGGLAHCDVEPRMVLRAALLTNAAAVILAHNHPSGDPTPSPDDLDLTRRIVAAAAIVGIEIADHLIIGDETYTSFKETGRL